MKRTLLVSSLAALALAGCGAGSKGQSVCNVSPSADGRTLVYSPPGCENHLKGGTLNIQAAPSTQTGQ